MTEHEVVRRLEAFHGGKPLPQGETLRVRRLAPADILVVAFVRMGGESAPWGIAYGPPDKAPRVLTAPEPRNRDFVADMMAEFAPTLLGHLQHPSHGGRLVERGDELATRQVWLPNLSHLEMFHNLAYSYTFTKFGSEARRELLNALGRAAGWLFREAHRPGQTAVAVATNVLTEAYTFPTETIRQGHLGFLLAWLTTTGGREARMRAAEKVERDSISTSLNPDFESKPLEPALAVFNEARAAKRAPDEQRAREKIHGLLKPDLVRRFTLTCEAIDVLGRDRRRENAGLDVLEKATRDEQFRQYLRIEYRLDDPEDGPPFVPSPETDRSPAAAASRYFVLEASQQLLEGLLVHDDGELADEMIAEGRAIRGTVISVANEGNGRTVPVWVLDADASLPLRLREGSDVCVLGCPKRQGVIRDVSTTGGRYRIEVQITTCVTVPRGVTNVLPATSPLLKGRTITLVPPPKDGISRLKSRRVWDKDVAGKRLTQAAARGVKADLPDEVVDPTFQEV
jgi:hypothetical protein